jgi:hypothetical protein
MRVLFWRYKEKDCRSAGGMAGMELEEVPVSAIDGN